MKKFLVLSLLVFATSFLLQSCGEDATGPVGKQNIAIAKTNSNLMIPLALGNKWVYMSSDSVLYSEEITLIKKGNCKDMFEPNTIPFGEYTLYVSELKNATSELRPLKGILNNKVFLTDYSTDSLYYSRIIYDELLGVRDTYMNEYFWHNWFKSIDVELDFAYVKDAKLVIYDKNPDENNILYGEVVKKGVGIIKFWRNGKEYKLINVTLN